MSGRPPSLFPLFAEMSSLPGLGAKTADRLAQIGLLRPRDLLFALPLGGIDRRMRDSVSDVPAGEVATVRVTVLRHIPSARAGRPYRVQVEDSGIAFTLVWFRGQERYLKDQLPVGEDRIVSGKVEHFDGHVQMVHPDHVLPLDRASDLPEFEPIYGLTEGVSARVMARSCAAALERAPDLEEWIDPQLRVERGWPGWREALGLAHAPSSLADLSPDAPSRERLAYDEFFAHQLTLGIARARAKRQTGHATRGDGRLQNAVRSDLGFAPTAAQERAIAEIAADMAGTSRMNRLLQGDVGSGKTLVALLALLAAVESGAQGVLMAPTEILARQHLESIAPLAKPAGVEVEILTGRDKGKVREDKLARLAAGDIDILIGTHALFQPGVEFADLRLAVVDEQHRFGVRQRLELGRKGDRADVLVMTATPIPRSLALARYGDMDLSVLDEKPPGRKPVQTALVGADRLDDVVAHLQQAVADGRQAYWVCPLVAESETRPMAAAEDRFAALRAVLPEGSVGLVHGQMPSEKKDAEMARFVSGQTKVLVATTVIEVGVNVPNATIMVIEQAESFGLAQLHQLRGRVGRGSEASTCLLVYQSPLGETARRRLLLLRESEDGFAIAEEDLAIRGAGDVLGLAQSGLPQFRVGSLETQAALMETAQKDARALLTKDPDLSGPRGAAARSLLWMLDQNVALEYLRVG